MQKPKGDSVVVMLDETSSTNAKLRQLQQEDPLPEGSVVITDFQTQGRGQIGNTWHSKKGKNLLFSVLLYPHSVKPRDQFVISRIVSLAIKRVLDKYMSNVTVKWPNDIYWNDKKIAGILIENSLIGQLIDYTIVGVGLNVNEDNFPSHLPNPVSMKQVIGDKLDRDEVFTMLRYEFFDLYALLMQGSVDAIEQEYMSCLFRKDGLHWFVDRGGRFQGVIKTILSSGHLVLEIYPDKRERVYAFKEVSFELNES